MEAELDNKGYFRQNRDDISDLVSAIFESNARFRVIDIGCGEGYLSSHLAQKYKNAFITGIEINDKAANEARQKCNEVITGDIEKILLNKSGLDENTFDCAILADVLEHLVNPWDVLKKIKRILKDTGRIVASIPNIGNYGVIYYLLRGKWEYRDEGIMDRSHLRFFTLDGIVKMFADAGFEVEQISANLSPYNEEIIEKMAECVTNLGGDAQKFRDESQVFQYLITFKKSIPDFMGI